jgi:hypothetical protein
LGDDRNRHRLKEIDSRLTGHAETRSSVILTG